MSRRLGKAVLPRGVTVKGGRFAASLRWSGEADQYLGLFETLSEAVAARFHAERRQGWQGVASVASLSLEQRQALAERQFAESGGSQILEASREAHRLASRARDRRSRGWCAECAKTVPAGEPRLCEGGSCGAAEASAKARRAPQRARRSRGGGLGPRNAAEGAHAAVESRTGVKRQGTS